MATIEKRGKTYTARISLKVDGKYKRKSKSGFKTKTAAKSWAIEQENLKNNGADVLGAKILFSDYFYNWYTLYKTNITESSLRWYTLTHKIIIEHLAGITLEQLTRPMLQGFFNTIGENYTYSTSKKIRMYIRGSIRNAIYDGLISRDPTLDITLSGSASKDKELKYLDEPQLRDLVSFISEIPSTKRSASDQMILFGANTGCRYQEIAVLSLNDISGTKLTIDKAYEQYTKSVKTTKTDSSSRIIDIPLELVNQLKDWAAHKSISDDQLLFSYDGVNPISSNAANNRLKAILHTIGSDKIITFHGLRHPHASLLLAHGTNIQYVSERLGHASASITLNTYAHLLQKVRDEETDKLLSLYSDMMSGNGGK